jgi:hypothetical protein
MKTMGRILSMGMLSAFVAFSVAFPAVPRVQEKQIEAYVDFIKSHRQEPVDYVLGLFEDADIVILCERAHPEITQYELIADIIRDKRFIEKAGYIFTEIGRSNLQPDVESLLMSEGLSEKEAKESLLYIIRNLQHSPLWECTNYFDLLQSVYNLNKTLPLDEKIHIYPSNMPFSWQGMTKEKYAAFYKMKPRVRDRVIAEQIIGKYHEILNSDSPRKKALVIMNYRHAFPHLDVTIGSQQKHVENVGGFLRAEFPGKVANVMLNSIRILAVTETEMSWTALQDGKWDAAFARAGNPDIGFDFNGSPFGSDAFDYFPYQHDYKYSDVFSGFVFYKPLEEHIMRNGIPGIFNAAFKKEFIKRHRIADKKTMPDEEIEKLMEELGKIHEFGYDEKDRMGESDYKERIRRWLNK